MGLREATIVPKLISVGASTTSSLVTSGTTITFNHTVESNVNMCLFVCVVQLTSSTNNTVTGITYNGVALTQAANQTDDALAIQGDIWYLYNPALGTNQVVVTTLNNMTTTSQGQAISVAMSNVDPAVTDGGLSIATGTNTTTFGTCNNVNYRAVVLDMVVLNTNQAVTFNENQTPIAEVQVTGSDTGTMSLAYLDVGNKLNQIITANWSSSDSLIQLVLPIRRG